MPSDLVRTPAVELVRTGRWSISSGTWEPTAADLAAAVEARQCPAIRNPVIKLGHTDGRFNGDGEPALGWYENLRLADGGHTLVADQVTLPWLAKVQAAAYPDRSVEGNYRHRCQLGHTHPFVVTAVALLGVTPPGVGTLQSLQDLPDWLGVAAAAEIPEGATRVQVTVRASNQQEGADMDGEPVVVDATDPGLDVQVPNIILPVAAAADSNLREYWLRGEGAAKIRWGTDGDFTRCVRQLRRYVRNPEGLCAEYHFEMHGKWPGEKKDAAAASDADADETTAAGDAALVAEVAASIEPPAAEPDPSTTEEDRVSELTAGVRQRLGLPDDADEAAVLAALDERLTAPTPNPEPEPEPEPAPQEPPSVAQRQPEPVSVSASGPDPALVQQMAMLKEQVEALSAQLAAVNAEKAAAVKASVLDEAQKAGKFTPAQRDVWERHYDAAPEVTASVLASIAPGTAVPVAASGHTGPAEPQAGDDAEWEQISRQLWPAETAKGN